MSRQLSTTKVLPEEFDEVIAGHSVAVFHFYASWNRYDLTMDRMLCEIADAYKDQIFIGSIDTDDQENWERCKELRILNLPAIAAFVNSQHFETVIGLLSKKSLNSKVQKWLDTARRNGRFTRGGTTRAGRRNTRGRRSMITLLVA